MRVQCSREGLLLLAKQVSYAAARPPSPQELCGIHIQADAARSILTLTATNQSISIRTSICVETAECGSVIAAARLLPPILSRLPDETVTLEQSNGGRLSIRSGAAAYELDVLPGERYPTLELPYPEDTTAVTGLRTLVRQTAIATASQPEAPLMGCVQLVLDQNGLKGRSTNGFCVLEAAGDDACKGQSELLVPVRSLAVLASLSRDSDVYEMGLAGKSAVFWNGTLLFSARLMEGVFPNAAAVLERFQGRYAVCVQAEALSAALSTVTALQEGDKGRIALDFREHTLVISAQSACGTSALPVEALVLDKPDQALYYDPGVLLAYLKQLKGDVTLEFDSTGVLAVRHMGTRYLQCPMRPPKTAEARGKRAA